MKTTVWRSLVKAKPNTNSLKGCKSCEKLTLYSRVVRFKQENRCKHALYRSVLLYTFGRVTPPLNLRCLQYRQKIWRIPSFFLTEKIAPKTTMLRTQLGKGYKINMQRRPGLSISTLKKCVWRNREKQFISFLYYFKYISCIYWLKQTFKKLQTQSQ